LATADILAAEYGVSPATVKRAGKTAERLDTLDAPDVDGEKNLGIAEDCS